MDSREIEVSFTITEVARILKISRTTVYKWISKNAPEHAIIPREGWFVLPTGHIRIRGAILKGMLRGDYAPKD